MDCLIFHVRLHRPPGVLGGPTGKEGESDASLEKSLLLTTGFQDRAGSVQKTYGSRGCFELHSQRENAFGPHDCAVTVE